MHHYLKAGIQKHLHAGMNGRIAFLNDSNLLSYIFQKTHNSISTWLWTIKKDESILETNSSAVPLYLRVITLPFTRLTHAYEHGYWIPRICSRMHFLFLKTGCFHHLQRLSGFCTEKYSFRSSHLILYYMKKASTYSEYEIFDFLSRSFIRI